MNTYDPLPPPDSICSYTFPESRRQRDSDGSFLSLFLRSLLPSYGMPNGNDGYHPQANQQEHNEVERLPQGAERAAAIVRPGLENHITESAQRLMGAMRELLNSMAYRGDLEEHQGDSEDDFNEEEWQDNEELQDPEDFLD